MNQGEASPPRPHRQAVVIIHGIGEQRPMQTLRSFAQGVLGGKGPDFYFSKPDRMATSFELRRLQAHSTSRPSTDFYEYYWAHEMRGTKVSHVLRWVRMLLLRRPGNVPVALRPAWYLTVVLLAFAVGFSFLNIVDLSTPTGIVALLAGLGAATVQGFLVSSLGDAARYLDPHPENVSSRQVIRANGVELLRQLHEANRYDRIIVVGHSLGSVIAYDVLTFLWQDLGHKLRDASEWPAGSTQRALRDVEETGIKLSPRSSSGDVRRFQARQRDLWLEQRQLGNPWLVTDLVTLGSPLAHASMLLASSPHELIERQEDRELPTCPPRPGRNPAKECYSYRGKEYDFRGGRRRVRVLHHAALFAPTRWTNVYVPIRAGFAGDLVGGPLRGVLGDGIRDIPLTKGLLRYLPLVSHSYYWRVSRFAKDSDALPVLKSVLGLGSEGWLPPVPPGAGGGSTPPPK